MDGSPPDRNGGVWDVKKLLEVSAMESLEIYTGQIVLINPQQQSSFGVSEVRVRCYRLQTVKKDRKCNKKTFQMKTVRIRQISSG